MAQSDILLPVMALVGWTLCVLSLVPYRRFKAGAARQVTFDDFKYGESAQVPEAVRLPNRVYINLLEGPVLFYVLCVLLFVTRNVDALAVTLAWVYVIVRLIHSLVYLSYNNVPHRLAMFALSNVVLAIIWVRLFMGLVGF